MTVLAVRGLGSFLCLFSIACRCGNGGDAERAGGARADFSIRGAERMVVFDGTCDASGAVALSERALAVADDENNVLRVYDAYGGGPSTATDLSAAIGLQPKGKRRNWPEADIEAGTRIGDRAYWITSHGRSSKGQLRPERLRFFATTLGDGGQSAQLWGQPNEQLLRDLLDEPRLSQFDLRAASQLAPKAPGGLNIEGLSATPDGHLLIGFRNPNPDRKALIVPLLNADATLKGERAQFGAPILLELQGRGVRAVVPWSGGYLLVAGHFDRALPSQLYVWDGASALRLQSHVAFGDFNPEAIFAPATGDQVLLLSDDGEYVLDGAPCKKLRDDSRKKFRGAWVKVR